MYMKNVGIALSILLNTVLGGSPYQTFSARNWERKQRSKLNLVCLIDSVYVIIGYIRKTDLTDHCKSCWEYWDEKDKNKKS